MREKKYKPLNLPVDLVEELKVWRLAYSKSRDENVTFETMIRDMIACNRKFKWWRNNERDIVTKYKAIKLRQEKNIELIDAEKAIIKHDSDPNSSSRGRNSELSIPYSQLPLESEYMWDKDWKDLI